MPQKTVRLSVDIPPEIRYIARVEAAKQGVTIKQYITTLITKAVAKTRKEV